MRTALLLAAWSCVLAAQDLATRMGEAVKSIADNHRKFMGSVLVAQDGTVILSRGYGFANLEWDIPNTPATKFRLGSISALYSTTEDLLRWEQAFFGGKAISPESLRKMTAPVMHNYAYGLTVMTDGPHKMIGHNGGIDGFNTQLNWYPDDKFVVVVLANLNGMASNQIGKRLGELAVESSR